MEFTDYYQILEIEKNTPAEEIGKAYRKLARKYHPDVNPGDEEAAARFRDISEAHHVLSNPEARAKYDRLDAARQAHLGSESSAEPFDWQPWVSPDLADQPLDEALAQLESSSDTSFSPFFHAIFGGMNLIEPGASPSQGQDYHQTVEISLEEVYTGASRILRVGNRRLEVRIPRGAQTGTKVRIRGEGGLSADGTTKGDLYLEVQVAPHPSFRREGDDLHLDLPVNVYSAVLGGEVVVPIIKGKIKLRIPPETQSGRIFRLKGQGLPGLKNPDERGDLFAKVMITVPENLTEEEIELFEELADIRGL
ncbi:MAG: DnaJ C-terminal domain-containing protein [Anaerolineae bacterium]